MKVSGFTFLRNGQKLGYPFVASIRSILPVVDEFIIALGPCGDDTEKMLREIRDPKIRIIPTQWNERIRSDYSIKGFVFGQQKSIALFNCTGDWAFYLEGDEVLHENDLPKIRAAMEKHLNNDEVEALYFDYIHFLGNKNTRVWSPGWYRTEARILRNTIPAWASEGLFFNIVVGHKKSRYPRAASAGATIYHYGNMRTQEEWNLKAQMIGKYWSDNPKPFTYADVDPQSLKPFTGTHPKVVQSWLPPAEGLFRPAEERPLKFRDFRHRIMARVENRFGLDFTHKHYKRVA